MAWIKTGSAPEQLFFLTVWPVRSAPQEEGNGGSGAHLSSYCCKRGRWEELNVQHGAWLCHGEIGHEERWENGPFLAWPKSATPPLPPTIYLFILSRVGVRVSLSANASVWPCLYLFSFFYLLTFPPQIWDKQSLECLKILTGHTGSVLCLQYDERVIVTGSSDSTVRYALDFSTMEFTKCTFSRGWGNVHRERLSDWQCSSILKAQDVNYNPMVGKDIAVDIFIYWIWRNSIWLTI